MLWHQLCILYAIICGIMVFKSQITGKTINIKILIEVIVIIKQMHLMMHIMVVFQIIVVIIILLYMIMIIIIQLLSIQQVKVQFLQNNGIMTLYSQEETIPNILLQCYQLKMVLFLLKNGIMIPKLNATVVILQHII